MEQGRGELPSEASLNRGASADPAPHWPELPVGKDVRVGRFYFWLLDKDGEMGVTERWKQRGEGPPRMKGMVQKGLIMWRKVFSNFCKSSVFLRELGLQPFGRLTVTQQLETGQILKLGVCYATGKIELLPDAGFIVSPALYQARNTCSLCCDICSLPAPAGGYYHLSSRKEKVRFKEVK